MTDPLSIVVDAFAAAYAESGRCPIEARVMAEEATQNVLNELRKHKAPVGTWLRRIKVYTLRSRGVSTSAMAERFGISREQVWRDYRGELMRRRSGTD